MIETQQTLTTQNPLILAIIASTIVGLLTLPLGYLFLKQSKLKVWLELNFIGLCAGIMLGNSLNNLLPEALNLTQDFRLVSASVLAGIVGFFLFEKSSVWFHHHDESHGEEPTTKLILIGDSIHNFIDGIAISIAFMTNINLGIITTAAIILHEIPTEISDLSVLINKGMKVKKAIWFNFLTALTSILGTIVGFFMIERFSGFQAPLLGVASGMFIYIACSDLIPDLHKEPHKTNTLNTIIVFLIGILITFISSFLE